jgi:glycine hydroxymethyltransferase
MADALADRGFAIVSGGTDCHLLLVDLRPKQVTGKAGEASLERAGITVNKNAIPFDPEKPTVTSGIRLGSPAATTRGFGPAEFRAVADMINQVLEGLAQSNVGSNDLAERAVRERVLALCAEFPIYRRAEGR